MRIVLFLLFFASLHGCASITQGTSQTLTFKLEPKEAKCTLSRSGDGELGSVTLASNTILVHKDKDDIIVQCAAPGYLPRTTRIVSSATTAGVTGVMLDLGITDMITGAMYAYPPDLNISLDLDQASPPTLTPSSHATATIQTKEERLKELKQLNDAGLINNEIYIERQKAILSSP